MAKANKDGWIRHRGGKCPVEAGTLVDVRYRNGKENHGVHALREDDDSGSISWANAHDWSHSYSKMDIMSWRPHKADHQLGGPLQWRDRIRQIDAEEAKRNEEHRQAIEALEEERLSLVQKLEAEGFKLIDKINAGLEETKQTHEDMSDWRNWKIGDKVEILRSDLSGPTGGCIATVEYLESEPYDGIYPAEVRNGTETGWPELENMKWHSRP